MNCASPQTVQGPFAFAVSPTATAHTVPASLESLVVSPHAPKTGGMLSVTAELWIGGSPQPVDAVACKATSGRRTAFVKRGPRGGCAWTLPRKPAASIIRGTITLSAGPSEQASVPFAVRVRR